MPRLKAIHYIAGVSATALLCSQAALSYHEYKLEQRILQLSLRNLQMTSGSSAGAQEGNISTRAALMPLQNLQTAAGETQYAMRPPAPYTDNEVPKAQQRDIAADIEPSAKRRTARRSGKIPEYHPASQMNQAYLNSYLPRPDYRLQPWQYQKLHESGVLPHPEPTAQISPPPAEKAEMVPGGTIDGSVALTSSYTFRGINQSKKKPAIQGSLEYKHESGFYAGGWASNVDFNDHDHAQLEIDGYGGYRTQLTKELSSDIGVIYYSYPGSESRFHYNYAEIYASGEYAVPINMKLGHGFDSDKLKVGASLNYSPNYFARSGNGYYLKGSAALPFSNGLTLDAHLGKQWISNNSAFGWPDAIDWAVGLAYDLPEQIELKVQYIDTNISKNRCSDDSSCNPRGIFSISKSF